MKIAFAIISLLWSLWLLYVWIRYYLPEKYDSYRNTVGEIILGLLFVYTLCAHSIALVSGGSWLRALAIAFSILLWMVTLWLVTIEHGHGRQ